MLVLAIVLPGTTAAYAGTSILATAPASAIVSGAQQQMWCNLVNLDTSAQTVTTSVLDFDGTLLAITQVTVEPNQGTYLPDGSGQGAWCKFTVNTSPKKFRAMAIYSGAHGYTASVPAQ